ncbi:hypothetical protein V1509DRAFT_624746 [Lipomyces kononenkoae]
MAKKVYFGQIIIGAMGLIFIAALLASTIFYDQLASYSENLGISSTSLDVISVTANGSGLLSKPSWRTAAIHGAVSTFRLIVTGAIGIYVVACIVRWLAYMGVSTVAGIHVSLIACVMGGILFAVLSWASTTLLSYEIQV